jgi:hypothetical protein
MERGNRPDVNTFLVDLSRVHVTSGVAVECSFSATAAFCAGDHGNVAVGEIDGPAACPLQNDFLRCLCI